MKKLFLSLTIIFSVIHLSSAVITVKDFAELIKSNKDLIIVDCDRAANYAATHIKGAINIFPQELFNGKPDGIFKSTEEMAKFFGSRGISEKSTVVLYDDGTNKYTSTIYFLLKYLGAGNVSILTRNMTEFEKYRIPLTSAPVKITAVTFTPTVNTGMLTGFAEYKTKSATGSLITLDTRKPDEFQGIDADKKSKGHLPGAIGITYKEFLKADGSYKSKEEIEALVLKNGLSPEKEIVVYCNSGVLAAIGYYALKEILGYPNVKILEGGYNHWVLDPSNTLEK